MLLLGSSNCCPGNELSPGGGCAVLQEKDAIIFLQRFAKLQHEGRILGLLKAKFETTLLDLLYTVCTVPGHYVSTRNPLPPHSPALWARAAKILPNHLCGRSAVA